jgi:hypothetical protein
MVPIARRRLLQLGLGVTLAAAACAVLPTALQADSPRPPLPDSIQQALNTLTTLGFEDIVSVFYDLRPSIELQPLAGLSFVGLTEGWVTGHRRTATVKLRTDLEGCPAMLASVLAHELLHVRQFAHQPDVYANCLEREVPAYQLQVAVLKAWCVANPLERYGLPVSTYSLMSMADYHNPESLESFASSASCGIRYAAPEASVGVQPSPRWRDVFRPLEMSMSFFRLRQ